MANVENESGQQGVEMDNNNELIAPCGMDCSVCNRYLARKYDTKNKGVLMAYCIGCRPRDRKCAALKKRCDLLLAHDVGFCYECCRFPCRNLKRLDARYQKHYRTSLIENLNFIRDHSLAAFFERENAKWRCPQCGDMLCCHNGVCFNCSLDRLKMRKLLYRWDQD
ncbi:MAG: DUF3795 domain-containing protein [Halobacteriota archaeon]